MSDGNEMDEIDAMRAVAEALKDLEAEPRRRVLRWVNDRFGHPAASATSASSAAAGGAMPADREAEHGAAAQQGTAAAPASLDELFAAVAPDTDAERALVVAYWVQEANGGQDFDAATVNKELKHLGHGVGNITDAFTKLIAQRPQPVIQTRKEGTSKQARKKYKVTAVGKREVERRFAAGSAS